MPAKLRSPPFAHFFTPIRTRICTRCLRRARSHPRNFSNSTAKTEAEAPGRWSYTPERMKAPVSMNFHNKDQEWHVNESAEKLDEFYRRLLGDGGDVLLTDEVKWLALTHKTFEQGKRGYNDRLAFLGKRIYNLQASLALLNRTDGTFTYPADQHERIPFQHPGIDLLPRLTLTNRKWITNQNRIAEYAMRQGMLKVMRWKPRNVGRFWTRVLHMLMSKIHDLRESGVDGVLASGVYAILGALALQRGGELTNRFMRERVLPEIGLPQQD